MSEIREVIKHAIIKDIINQLTGIDIINSNLEIDVSYNIDESYEKKVYNFDISIKAIETYPDERTKIINYCYKKYLKEINNDILTDLPLLQMLKEDKSDLNKG